MSFFTTFFCDHKWKSHAKKEREEINADKEVIYEYTMEVLICEHCGKIKKIKY